MAWKESTSSSKSVKIQDGEESFGRSWFSGDWNRNARCPCVIGYKLHCTALHALRVGIQRYDFGIYDTYWMDLIHSIDTPIAKNPTAFFLLHYYTHILQMKSWHVGFAKDSTSQAINDSATIEKKAQRAAQARQIC